MSICLFCKKTEILIFDWNKRCPECRAKLKAKEDIEKKQIDMGIGKRMPAAIIEVQDNKKTQVYVDKFGREVENPGYDLQHDPRGWNYTGIKPKEKKFIL